MDAEPAPGTNSAPLGLKSEGVANPHTHRLAGVQEASGPDTGTAPAESSGSRGRRAALDRLRYVVTWAPKNCRYDPDEPPKFSLSLNLLFALVRFRLVPKATHMNGVLTLLMTQAGTITVANLYYVQPILYKIADTFDVSFEKASSVATMQQVCLQRPYFSSRTTADDFFWPDTPQACCSSAH